MSALAKSKTQSQFSKAACVYSNHAKVQANASEILFAQINQRSLGLCLDLGAGPGVNSERLQQHSDYVLAVDLSEQMLKQIALRGNNSAVCADMDSLPLASNCFDSVFSNFAMQWSANIESALHELHRVLKPGGRAFIAIVADGSLTEVAQAFATVKRKAVNRFHSQHTIEHCATAVGFDVAWQKHSVLKDTFNSAQQALKSFRAIGASNCDKASQPMTKQQYHQILASLQGQHSHVTLSYQVSFFELVK